MTTTKTTTVGSTTTPPEQDHPQTDGYVVIDRTGQVVWGAGATPEAAMRDAQEWVDQDHGLRAVRATPALVAHVEQHGGLMDVLLVLTDLRDGGTVVSEWVIEQAIDSDRILADVPGGGAPAS